MDSQPPQQQQAIVPAGPDQGSLRAFHEDIRAWLELDHTVSRLSRALKEQRDKQTRLRDAIMGFMAQYNVEKVTAKDGRGHGCAVRYNVAQVLMPLTQATIKQRLAEFLRRKFGDTQEVEGLMQDAYAAIFAREKCARKSVLTERA
jgi:hypothetical protein